MGVEIRCKDAIDNRVALDRWTGTRKLGRGKYKYGFLGRLFSKLNRRGVVQLSELEPTMVLPGIETPAPLLPGLVIKSSEKCCLAQLLVFRPFRISYFVHQ
jgi:hypothetical protein